MSGEGLFWAGQLRNVTPVAKLIAIRVGDICSELSPTCVLTIDAICDWTNSEERVVQAAIGELSLKGVLRFDENRPGSFEFHSLLLPWKKPAEEERDHRPAAIYVVSSPRFVKIGISRHWQNRLSGLRANCPEHDLEIVWLGKGPQYLIRKVERGAHEALATHHRISEWFSVPVEQAIAVVSAEMLKYGLQLPTSHTGRPLPSTRA